MPITLIQYAYADFIIIGSLSRIYNANNDEKNGGNNQKGNGATIPLSGIGYAIKKEMMELLTIPNNKLVFGNNFLLIIMKIMINGIIKPTICKEISHCKNENI